jgi:hypothetical protein
MYRSGDTCTLAGGWAAVSAAEKDSGLVWAPELASASASASASVWGWASVPGSGLALA